MQLTVGDKYKIQSWKLKEPLTVVYSHAEIKDGDIILSFLFLDEKPDMVFCIDQLTLDQKLATIEPLENISYNRINS